MSFNVFAHHFSKIVDPRQEKKISYPLFDILFLTVTAVIAGSAGWEDIQDFGEAKIEWLRKYGSFEQGIPTHDTIARVISRINPENFQSCFMKWMQEIHNTLKNEVVAIDGKTLRSSYNREDRQSTIHMVSAFATANGVVMGQYKTAEKSNEITAIPELLALLELKGCLVTVDAMGCQKTIAKAIVDKAADYVLAVKGNQPTLYQAVKHALDHPLTETKKENILVEKHHGRIECREYAVLNADKLEGSFSEWAGLKSIGVAISYRIDKKKKESVEYRYYISSSQLDTKTFSHAVRAHKISCTGC